MIRHSDFVQREWLRQFKSALRKKRLAPLYVQWLATTQCSLNCGHCGTDAGNGSLNELKLDEIRKAVADLKKLGCKYLSVTGGEPLLRPDLFEALTEAKKKGINVSIVSNGYLTQEYERPLKKLGLYGVSISIDGYKAQHDRIRSKKGSYARCLKSIAFYKKSGVPLRQVASVVLESNISDMPRMMKDAFSAGCTRYRLQLLIPEGRARGRKNSSRLVLKALRIIRDARSKGLNVFAADNFGYLGSLDTLVRPYHFFCGCGWWTFTIMQDGDIMGCPAVDRPALNEGNIREGGLADIWWNGFKRFRQIRIPDLPKLCRDCEFVLTCRGGCWAYRISADKFCYLKEAEKVSWRETEEGR